MPPPDAFEHARAVIESGLASHAFPAAVVDVGGAAGSVWSEAFGRLSHDPASSPTTLDTVFDLASLTKVIATASIAMRLLESHRVALGHPAGRYLAGFRSADRAVITVRHLLDHSSGLPAHARIWEQASGREMYERALSSLPLERAPGTAAVYSDPGFILLGFLLEDAGGGTLDAQFAPLAATLGGPLLYRPPPEWRERIAPTENDPWRGRLLQGEVHDENAAALGGVAAHAGLFGTAGAVAAFARLVLTTFQRETTLGTPATMRTFAQRTGVADSTRALAWDTMMPTSSCGTRMSPTARDRRGRRAAV